MSEFAIRAVIGVGMLSVGFVLGALWCSFFRYQQDGDKEPSVRDEHEGGAWL